MVGAARDRGTLAGKAQHGWDVRTADGPALQVKARVLTAKNPSRQLSIFRSWEFDAAIVILFAETFQVQRAARLAVATIRDAARWQEYVKGWRLLATDELLAQGEDWTALVARAAATS